MYSRFHNGKEACCLYWMIASALPASAASRVLGGCRSTGASPTAMLTWTPPRWRPSSRRRYGPGLMLSWRYASLSYRLGNIRWMDSIIEVCFSQVTKATVSSVKNEWASIASNSNEIHALRAEIKEEMKREVLDSKSKIV